MKANTLTIYLFNFMKIYISFKKEFQPQTEVVVFWGGFLLGQSCQRCTNIYIALFPFIFPPLPWTVLRIRADFFRIRF